MDLQIKGKTALVTGGSQGIGFAIARELAREGVTVFIASRNEAHIEKAVSQLRQELALAQIEGILLDLSSEDQIRSCVKGLCSKHEVDILINNVGGPAAGKALDLTPEQWDAGYRSLLRSVILLIQLVSPQMKDKRWGRILTVTSTAAKELIPGLPISSTFRAGLSAFCKTVAKELGAWGILVNNLLPGPTNTARLKELSHTNPDFFNSMLSTSALGRIAEPEEMGKIAAFLCSGANTYITGTDILADGGYTRAI